MSILSPHYAVLTDPKRVTDWEALGSLLDSEMNRNGEDIGEECYDETGPRNWMLDVDGGCLHTTPVRSITPDEMDPIYPWRIFNSTYVLHERNTLIKWRSLQLSDSELHSPLFNMGETCDNRGCSISQAATIDLLRRKLHHSTCSDLLLFYINPFLPRRTCLATPRLNAQPRLITIKHLRFMRHEDHGLL